MHPGSFDTGLLDVMAEHGNVCRYFDLPVQHASDRVLRNMGRGYTSAQVENIIGSIRARLPDAVLRTTVMVGFPGETSEDFERLCEFVEASEFDHLGAFKYSDFEDLPAHHLPAPVSDDVAAVRYERIMGLQKKISLEKNRRYIGRSIPVLVEAATAPGVYRGRARFQAPEVDGVVTLRGGHPLVGSVVTVTVTGASHYDLDGIVE